MRPSRRRRRVNSKLYPFVRPALVNGGAGAAVAPRGRVLSVIAFTVTNGKIAEIDALLGGGSPCITR